MVLTTAQLRSLTYRAPRRARPSSESAIPLGRRSRPRRRTPRYSRLVGRRRREGAVQLLCLRSTPLIALNRSSQPPPRRPVTVPVVSPFWLPLWPPPTTR